MQCGKKETETESHIHHGSYSSTLTMESGLEASPYAN